MIVREMRSNLSILYQTIESHSTTVQQLEAKLNQILSYLMERKNKEMSTGMVTNAIITWSEKILGKDIELDDDPSKRENNDQLNVERKRPNDYELKPNDVIIESSKVKESQVVPIPQITIHPLFAYKVPKNRDSSPIMSSILEPP